MSNIVISQIKRDHLMNLLADGRREDGRQLDEFRKISIETGIIESAEGSAKVSLGNTTVMAGVKIIPGAPYMDAPGDGVITTGAELIPLAHHWLLLHGRYVCTSQRPQCQQCGLHDVCVQRLPQ